MAKALRERELQACRQHGAFISFCTTRFTPSESEASIVYHRAALKNECRSPFAGAGLDRPLRTLEFIQAPSRSCLARARVHICLRAPPHARKRRASLGGGITRRPNSACAVPRSLVDSTRHRPLADRSPARPGRIHSLPTRLARPPDAAQSSSRAPNTSRRALRILALRSRIRPRLPGTSCGGSPRALLSRFTAFRPRSGLRAPGPSSRSGTRTYGRSATDWRS